MSPPVPLSAARREPAAAPAPSPAGDAETGMTVEEQELGLISAQGLYQMRCECGRSWFELSLPNLAKCPACNKVGVVRLLGS